MAHYLKVADLFHLAPLKHARLVCGHDNTGNPVRGVNVIEAPDVADWIQSGDVLLTNLYAVDKLRPLDVFIDKLAKRKLSALIVKTGLFVDAIPDEIVVAARAHGLPVIEIPRDVLYREVMLSISEHLLNERLGALEKFKEINDYFVGISLANHDFYRIMRSLESFIGNPVALYDRTFQCLFSTDGSIIEFTAAGPFADESPYLVRSVVFPDLGGRSLNQYVFPVRVGEKVKLHLAVVQLNAEIEEAQLIAIKSAINLLALDFLKQYAVVEVEKHFRNDLISDLLSGRTLSSDEIYRRASLIQWDLRKHYAVVALAPAADRQAAAEPAEIDRLFESVDGLVGNVPLQRRDGHVVLFWDVTGTKDWQAQLKKRFAELAADWRRSKAGPRLRAGVGEVARGIADLAASHRQAQDALRVGIQAGFADDLVFFSKLGIYRLLCQYPAREELRDMIPPSLQKLMAGRARPRDQLLETLEAYTLSNGNALETSRRLGVHAKTVAYRLERIAELTGVDFADVDEMLMVQVGLKIMHLLGDGGADGAAPR
jgi:purine catabolism regulator